MGLGLVKLNHLAIDLAGGNHHPLQLSQGKLQTDLNANDYKRSLHGHRILGRLLPFFGFPGAAIVVIGVILADPIVASLTNKSP
jgi:hypothetical protein